MSKGDRDLTEDLSLDHLMAQGRNGSKHVDYWTFQGSVLERHHVVPAGACSFLILHPSRWRNSPRTDRPLLALLKKSARSLMFGTVSSPGDHLVSCGQGSHVSGSFSEHIRDVNGASHLHVNLQFHSACLYSSHLFRSAVISDQ